MMIELPTTKEAVETLSSAFKNLGYSAEELRRAAESIAQFAKQLGEQYEEPKQ